MLPTHLQFEKFSCHREYAWQEDMLCDQMIIEQSTNVIIYKKQIRK